MAFEIRLHRNVPREIRRVVREQIDVAITGLNGAREGHPKGIHDARKSFKAVRAVLRLVRPHLGNYYRKENLWYRNTARKLASVRDAQAHLETLDRLMEVREPPLSPPRTEELRAKLEERSSALHREQVEDAEAIDGLVEELVAARERVRRWPLGRDGTATIAPGLEATYERGRRGWKVARKSSDAVALHEWRKHVKYHRHHIRLLKNLWPEVMLGASATLKELSDLLGHHHDLHVFQTLVGTSSEFVRKRDRASLMSAADAQSRDLERQALVLGGLVYAEKPARFIARMSAYWRAVVSGEKADEETGAAEPRGRRGSERAASDTSKRSARKRDASRSKKGSSKRS